MAILTDPVAVRWRGVRALALVLVAGGAVVRPSPAQVRAAEYQVKAVFLYNFAQFVSWPDGAFTGAVAPIVIGVLGDDPFGPFLDATVEGELVGERPLVVRRILRLTDAAGCHILFISRSEGARLADIRNALQGRPVLLVSDIDGFAEQGGMIGLVMEQNRVRIQVNSRSAQAVGLMLSSKLLRIARVVGPAEN